MSKNKMWYCDRGCNVFESSFYSNDYPPECASCGSVMSTEPDDYDSVHYEIESRQIAEFEAE